MASKTEVLDDSEEKGPGGRPTKYDPAYAELLLQHLSEGHTLKSFAGRVKVHPDTIHKWRDAHPEFFDALAIGKASSLYFYEQAGIQGLFSETIREKGPDGTSTTHSKTINAPVLQFFMKNMHNWRDKIDQEVEVKNSDRDKLQEQINELCEEVRMLHKSGAI